MCAVLAAFCACAFINDFRYAREDQEYEPHGKGLVVNPRRPNVHFQQKKICSEEHLVDPTRVALEETQTNSVLEKLYPNYRKTEFASSIQLNYV